VKGVFYALLVPLDAITMGSVGSGCIRVGATHGVRGFVPSGFRVAVGRGGPTSGRVSAGHVAWQVGDDWLHATGPAFRLPLQTIERRGAEAWVRRYAVWERNFLPVANRGLADLEGGRSLTCWDAAIRAWSRGNYHLVPYLGSHGGLDRTFRRYSSDLPTFNFGLSDGPEFEAPPGFAWVVINPFEGSGGPHEMRLLFHDDPEPYVDPVSPSRASVLLREAWAARNRR
jgi:hypothetical protein